MTYNTFAAIGPNCWGIGETAEDAIRRAKSEWPSYFSAKPLKRNFSVYATDAPEIFVSELGDIAVNQGFKIEQIQKSALAR